ncbi:unnamed protein product [Dovyalis caffra]|uniref:Uncharacterized protein n=1 Tax=Dovyalis caffra TaxID=77055 RepID=A0AAV1RB05_9ROSI|nr:unnamed protein product [Dovyalis caffra]
MAKPSDEKRLTIPWISLTDDPLAFNFLLRWTTFRHHVEVFVHDLNVRLLVAFPGNVLPGKKILYSALFIPYGQKPLQPPLVGSMDPRNFVPPPPMPVQFRPVVPVQPQQFLPVSSPRFQPIGRGVTVMNAGLPPQTPQPQFPHSMRQLPARPNQPNHGPPPPQAMPLPNAQPNRHVMSGSPLPPPNIQTPNNYMPGLGGPGVPLSSSYTFAPSSSGQPPVTFNTVTQYQPMPQMHALAIPTGGQPALSSMNQNTAPVMPIQHNGEQS